jgi:hypothetical protein
MQAERSLLQQAAQTPLVVQNATNLPGVVHSPDSLDEMVCNVPPRLAVRQSNGSDYVVTHTIATQSLPETSTATTATSVPLLVVPIDGSIPVSDARPPTRKRGKSMSRRSGQTGSIQKEGNWYVVRQLSRALSQLLIVAGAMGLRFRLRTRSSQIAAW